MSKLLWDKDGQRTYETGVDHGILFRRNAGGTDYEKGVAWNGLTSVNETPSGAEANDFYADNIKYLTIMSAEDFGGTINAYTYPDEFAECNGQVQATTGVTVGQQDRRGFGMYYRTIIGNDTLGNAYGYKHHFVYNAKCQPSEMAFNTVNDSPEPIEMSWEFKTTPVALTSKDPNDNTKTLKPTAIVTIDDTKLNETKKGYLETLLGITEGTDAPGTYSPTSDATPQQGKTYYTRSGAGTSESPYVYEEFTGSTFAAGTTYYEEDPGTDPKLLTPDQIIALMTDGTTPS